jgi:amino acid adenylation domain-containing protein
MATKITSGFALSPTQQRLWQLGIRDGLATYRIAIDFSVAPGITVQDLCEALVHTANRHEILHSGFGLLNAMHLPVQAPLEAAMVYMMGHNDVAPPDPGQIGLQALEVDGRYRLTLSALCADGQTGLRLLQDVAMDLANESPTASDLQVSAEEDLPFSSVAQWQHDMLGEDVKVNLPSWPPLQVCHLPFLSDDWELRGAETSPATNSFEPFRLIRRYSIEVTTQLQVSINTLATGLGVSPDRLLFAAWGALLMRLRLEPVTVAYLAHGRSYDEMANLMGPFARFVPITIENSLDETLSDFVKGVAHAVEEALSVQDYLQPLPSDQSPTIAFSWHQALPETVQVTVSEAPFTWTDQCALMLSVFSQSGGEISLSFDYDACACDAVALDRLAEEFSTLLCSASANHHQKLGALHILGPKERQLVVNDFQGPVVPTLQPWSPAYICVRTALGASIGIDVIAETARRLDGPAFLETIEQISTRLIRAGVVRGDIVGLLLPRSIDMVAGILAIQQAGAAYLPLDTGFPEDRLAFMIEDSGAQHLLTSQAIVEEITQMPAFTALLVNIGVVMADVREMDGDHRMTTADFPVIQPHDLAYLIYTSGSTGRPKGVRVSHGALANHMTWMLRELPMGHSDSVLQKTAISFDASVWEIFAPLMTGALLALAPLGAERDPDELATAINDYGITVLQVVPSLLTHLVQNGRFRACHTLRRLCCGGEPLVADLARRTLELGVDLINLYGPTESTVQVIVEHVKEHNKLITIGKPIDNTRIYILDPHGQPSPIGVRGEIHIAGASLADGYHQCPELTAERFVRDPFALDTVARMFRSGDIGAWRSDGRIDFFGRTDRQVKLRGYRIELGEIDAVALTLPGVAQVSTIVGRDSSGIDQLLCFYSVMPSHQLDSHALKQAMVDTLPDYMTPNWIVQIKSFPTTPSGKIDIQALAELRPSSNTASVKPRDTLEMRIELIWGKVLGIAHVGINSSFFDLGGHSLLAVRLMAEIEKEFAHRLPLTSLFMAPTIAAQASLLREESVKMDSILVPIRSGNPDRSPIVLVHPTGGSVLCYRDLAAGLKTDRPIVALQDPGLSGDATYETIEELATSYLDRLEAVVSDRRYLLAGWSSGGVIAYEIARQALGRGHEISLLCLIDSQMTRTSQPPSRERLLTSISRLIAYRANIECPDLGGLPFDEGLQRLLQLAREADYVSIDADQTEIEKFFRVFERNVTAIGRYEAGRLPRRTLIMKAIENLPESIRDAAVNHASSDAMMGWQQLCFAELQEVSANHLSIMEVPGLTHVLAAMDRELQDIEQLNGLEQHKLIPMLGL